jgi:hypothetical protein
VSVPAVAPPVRAARGTSPTVREPVDIDTGVAHASRMYDYLLGGTNNFAIDRQLAQQMAEVFYGGLDIARSDVKANRAFLVRAVRHLVTEAGIRQFLDIGTGIPNGDNVHAVAQSLAPESRVVYVDYDLIVQAHARVLLQSTPEGATAFISADLRDPERILHEAAVTLDFARPVALVLVGVLHNIADDPHDVVARLVDALPSGSHLVISHMASDIHPAEMAEVMRRLDENAYEPFVARDRAGVSRFFDGLALLEPGLVPVDEWRPSEPPAPRPTPDGPRTTPIYGAVGRKS